MSNCDRPLQSALIVACFLSSTLSVTLPIQAQIVPDTTLPNPSIVVPTGNATNIEGGTAAGNNLFHSFQQFDLGTGQIGYFNNALTVENIFTRITGASPSIINGILRANGGANLFLLNPRGILFGENARLDLGGSFTVSTASFVQFADGSMFSTTPTATPPLLTVSVPIGLGFLSAELAGTIVNQSTTSNDAGSVVGLQVLPGNSLRLVAGEVHLEGGRVTAPGGSLSLIGIRSGVQPLDNGAIADAVYGDVRLTEQAVVNASSEGGGRIDVLGNVVSVRDGSEISAITRGTEAGRGITIQATERLEVTGVSRNGQSPSLISTQTEGTGRAGDLTVVTRTLIVDTGLITAATFSGGAGGNLSVRATEAVELSGDYTGGLPSGLVNAALGDGDAGNLAIATGKLIVRDGGVVVSGTRSAGNGGELSILAAASVEVTGTTSDGAQPSTLQSAAALGTQPIRTLLGDSVVSGNAGNLTIETNRLTVRDGGLVSTLTEGSGNAGDLTVRAGESVTVQGVSPTGGIISSLVSDTNGNGAGGNVWIETGTLQVSDRAFVSASTFGAGAGGNLNIQASNTVELIGTGFEDFQATFVVGALQGTFPPGTQESGLFSGAASTGNSGNITIDTQRLLLQNGAVIYAPTFQNGRGGNLNIRATESITLDASVLATIALPGSNGTSGNIDINTGQFLADRGGFVAASTLGTGAGGNITLNITQSVALLTTPEIALIPTGIFSNSVLGTGAAGDVSVTTPRLLIQDGASISAQSGALIRTGTIPLGGRGGDVAIAADLLEVRGISPDGVFTTDITASTFSSAPAGNLNVTVGRLILRDGGTLSTSSLGSGQGGSITVRAEDSVEVIGISPDGRVPSALLASSGNFRQQATGNGGDLTVITDTFRLQEGGTASVRSFGSGNAGNLTVRVEALRLESGAAIDGTTVAGRGGSIRIDAQQVELRQGSRIATDAGNTDGGNIAIATDTLVALENSDITANALEGTGGRVFIEASGIFGTQFRDRATPESDITATSSLGAEFDGVVAITTPEVEVQSFLNELTAEFLTTEGIIADSCLSHANDPQGSLTVTGTGGLPANPYRPSDTRYPIASIQTLEVRQDPLGGRSPQEDPQAIAPIDTKELSGSWQLGDPIQEARSIIATPDGRLLLGTAPPQAVALLQAKDLICNREG